jgi:hypothetical protein
MFDARPGQRPGVEITKRATLKLYNLKESWAEKIYCSETWRFASCDRQFTVEFHQKEGGSAFQGRRLTKKYRVIEQLSSAERPFLPTLLQQEQAEGRDT